MQEVCISYDNLYVTTQGKTILHVLLINSESKFMILVKKGNTNKF